MMMTILGDVWSELVSMFVGDARLSAAVLALVGLCGGAISLHLVSPVIGGSLLLVGCLGILVFSVLHGAYRSPAAARTVADQEQT